MYSEMKQRFKWPVCVKVHSDHEIIRVKVLEHMSKHVSCSVPYVSGLYVHRYEVSRGRFWVIQWPPHTPIVSDTPSITLIHISTVTCI
jgi:hypothetical protein